MTQDWKPIRKVGIVGGGIAGMGMAACLKALSHRYPTSALLEEIHIFEARDNYLQSQLGGGVQLSGGAKIIEELGFYSQLKSVSKTLQSVTCRNSNNRVLFQIDIKESIERQQISDLVSSIDGEAFFCTVMRDALLSLLHNISSNHPTTTTTDPKSAKVSIFPGHRGVKLHQTTADGRISLTFSKGDRTSQRYEDYDVILLADGVNSLIKQPQLGFRNLLGKSLEQEASDTGIRITYLVLPDETASSSDRAAFQQFMGDGVYALIGSYAGLQGRSYTMLAIIYKEESGDNGNRSENAEWCSSALSERAISTKLRRGRLDHYEGLQSIIRRFFIMSEGKRNDEEYRIFDLGVKNRMIPLSSWSSMNGRVVLVGDSAHAMAPFFGQGANQALQDAYSLANLIHQHNQQRAGSLEEISREYERRRKWAASKLVLKSYFLGQLETLGGSIGTPAKDIIFQTLFQLGITEREFLEAATPIV